MRLEKRFYVGVGVRVTCVTVLLTSFFLLPFLTLELQGTEVWCRGWRASAGDYVEHGVGACFRLLQKLNRLDSSGTYVAIPPETASLDEEIGILFSILVAFVAFSDLLSLFGISGQLSGANVQIIYIGASYLRLCGVLIGWAVLYQTSLYRKLVQDNDAYIGIQSNLGSGAVTILIFALLSYVFPSSYGDRRL